MVDTPHQSALTFAIRSAKFHTVSPEAPTKKVAFMTSSHEVSTRRCAWPLLGLTAGLLALQVLNLAVFDDLRTDPSAELLDTFTKPQHLSSIVAVLLAVVLVAVRHRLAARVAVVVAWIEIAAFTFFHGIPVEIGPAKPYWGDGSGDALQWVGFISILACSAAIVLVAGRQSPKGAVATIAAPAPA